MNRQERKDAVQVALQRLWARGWHYDDVAAQLGVDRRTVSRWNCGALAPKHPQLWAIEELSQPKAVRELVRDVAKEPTVARVERLVELIEGGALSGRQLNAVEWALSRSMP